MDFREIIKLVKDSLYCQVCGTQFDDTNIELAGYQGNTLYFHAYCDRGHNPANSLIKAVAPAGMQIKELLTLYGGDPVKHDEMLDLKNFLHTFNGDFESIFH